MNNALKSITLGFFALIQSIQAADLVYDQAEVDEINQNISDITALQTQDATLQTNIAAETTARTTADAALQTNIDTEEAARTAADMTLQTNIDANRRQIDRNSRGIAMVAALTHTTVLPGMTHALDVSAAHFDGETGMAISYSRRLSEGVQVNFGAASTTDFEESVVRAGVGFQW